MCEPDFRLVGSPVRGKKRISVGRCKMEIRSLEGGDFFQQKVSSERDFHLRSGFPRWLNLLNHWKSCRGGEVSLKLVKEFPREIFPVISGKCARISRKSAKCADGIRSLTLVRAVGNPLKANPPTQPIIKCTENITTKVGNSWLKFQFRRTGFRLARI